jgi:hypothetical protein
MQLTDESVVFLRDLRIVVTGLGHHLKSQLPAGIKKPRLWGFFVPNSPRSKVIILVGD